MLLLGNLLLLINFLGGSSLDYNFWESISRKNAPNLEIKAQNDENNHLSGFLCHFESRILKSEIIMMSETFKTSTIDIEHIFGEHIDNCNENESKKICHLFWGFVIKPSSKKKHFREFDKLHEALYDQLIVLNGIHSVTSLKTLRLNYQLDPTAQQNLFQMKGDKNDEEDYGKTPSWGLDRLDQSYLPLDGTYKPEYSGKGTNVFVVDSGLDSTHKEFYSTNGNRVVKNLFDAYNTDVGAVSDSVGHGTHCAGIIGGSTIGVSPGANIFGVKVLDASGAGDSLQILRGLDFVLKWYQKNNRPPTTISMSLGGDCFSTEECEKDPIVAAVELLISQGITVVVAAGNDECDSCLETPAFAPNALTVGASTKEDQGAFFSDWGQCVDVFAPGNKILSACAGTICGGDETAYIEMSGTSMAAPFVAGVVAQILEVNPEFTPEEVYQAVTCTAAKGVLHLPHNRIQTSATRNLLLQIPKKDSVSKFSCNIGEGCPDSCSGNGYCQEGDCLCDTLYYGRSCSSMEFGSHCSSHEVFVEYTLTDKFGDGWHGSEMAIIKTPITNGVIGNAYTVSSSSMCRGFEEKSGVCLVPNERYEIRTQKNENTAADKGWKMCDARGGIPFAINFTVSANGDCFVDCDATGENEHAAFVEMSMKSGTNTYGWSPDKHYTVMLSESGRLVGGGSMIKYNNVEVHKICIRGKGSVTRFAVVSSAPPSRSLTPMDSIADTDSWSACGEERYVDTDFALFEYDWNTQSCHLVTEDDFGFPINGRRLYDGQSNKAQSVRIGFFDLEGHGWENDSRISVNGANTHGRLGKEFAFATLADGGAGQVTVEIPSTVASASFWISSTTSSSFPLNILMDTFQNVDEDVRKSLVEKFWITCGESMIYGVPLKFTSGRVSSRNVWDCHRKCIDIDMITNTGKPNSPEILSHYTSVTVDPYSDKNFIWTYDNDRDSTLLGIQQLGLMSDSFNSICLANYSSLSLDVLAQDYCVTMIIGGGTVMGSPGWELCGEVVPSTASMQVCVKDWTDCTIKSKSIPDCSAGMVKLNGDTAPAYPMYLLVFSLTKDGWHGAEFMIASEEIDDQTGDYRVIGEGTLDNGMSGAADLCLADGCYMIGVSYGEKPEVVNWNVCGQILGAGTVVYAGISDGKCVLYESMYSCQNPGWIERSLNTFLITIRLIVLLGTIVASYYLWKLCFKLPPNTNPTSIANGGTITTATTRLQQPNDITRHNNNDNDESSSIFSRMLSGFGFQTQPVYTPLHSQMEDHERVP